MSENRSMLPSLNGLRAISILMVLLNHNGAGFVYIKDILPFIGDGQLGVNIFFVISGFLITSLLINEEENGNVSLKKFYIRRSLRIFPAYYFMLLVYFILQLTGYLKIPFTSWLTALTFTKYFNDSLDWYTQHGWTLSIEEHFYLCWPLVFLIGKKTRPYFLFLTILVVPFIKAYFHSNPISWVNDHTIFFRIDAIAMGCIFAIYQKEIIGGFSKYWNVVFLLSLTTIAFLYLTTILSLKFGWHLGFIIVPIGGSHGLIANMAIACILMYSVFGPKKIWFYFLNAKVMNQIGIWSYSLYLWQQFYIYKTDFWGTYFPQNFIFIFITAIISYYLIEKPFMALKEKFIV